MITKAMTHCLATAHLRIDLSALSHNLTSIRRLAPNAEVCCVVKADAYGLGMREIALHFLAQGVKTFFVARLSEGIALRQILDLSPAIYVLDGLGIGQNDDFITHDLRPVLSSCEQIKTWLKGSNDLICALHIDTGMNRLGVKPNALAAMGTIPDTHKLSLIMSHLACADEPRSTMNNQQLIDFIEAAKRFPNTPKSLSNSAGCFLGPDYHFELLRPGIALYGGGPFGVAHPDLKPVVYLSAKILQIRNVTKGETIGYGASFIAPNEMRVATIGIGYADGLLRHFSPDGHVYIYDKPCRILGRISMDLTTIDITGIDAKCGDFVEILGPNQGIDALAHDAQTIGYEILTRLGQRFERRYTNEPIEAKNQD